MKKGDKLGHWAVSLDKWTDPLFIEAVTPQNASKKALVLFPVCDCGCGEKTYVTAVRRLR